MRKRERGSLGSKPKRDRNKREGGGAQGLRGSAGIWNPGWPEWRSGNGDRRKAGRHLGGPPGLPARLPVAVSCGGSGSGCGRGRGSRLCISVGCVSALQERRELTLQIPLPRRPDQHTPTHTQTYTHNDTGTDANTDTHVGGEMFQTASVCMLSFPWHKIKLHPTQGSAFQFRTITRVNYLSGTRSPI